ncbi:hypothetical protein SCA6_017674 [Theobroma cacao]
MSRLPTRTNKFTLNPYSPLLSPFPAAHRLKHNRRSPASRPAAHPSFYSSDSHELSKFCIQALAERQFYTALNYLF